MYRADLPPSGLARDGVSTVYQKFPVTAGRHHLRVRLKDSARAPDFNFTRETYIDLLPGQIRVVEFNSRNGGFVIK